MRQLPQQGELERHQRDRRREAHKSVESANAEANLPPPFLLFWLLSLTWLYRRCWCSCSCDGCFAASGASLLDARLTFGAHSHRLSDGEMRQWDGRGGACPAVCASTVAAVVLASEQTECGGAFATLVCVLERRRSGGRHRGVGEKSSSSRGGRTGARGTSSDCQTHTQASQRAGGEATLQTISRWLLINVAALDDGAGYPPVVVSWLACPRAPALSASPRSFLPSLLSSPLSYCGRSAVAVANESSLDGPDGASARAVGVQNVVQQRHRSAGAEWLFEQPHTRASKQPGARARAGPSLDPGHCSPVCPSPSGVVWLLL